MNSNQYSFCKFKIPEVGGRVIWEITNECNYGCKYCIFSSSGKKPLGELNTENIYKTMNELKEMNFNYIKFTGGEPFLQKDMVNILKYGKKIGFIMDISTNASKITEEISYDLSLLNLNYIHVSVDGFDQNTHESVRGKKSFAPTINGLINLKKFNNKVRIGAVLHLHNQDFIKEMIDYYNTLNVDEIIFSLMEPVGRLKGQSSLLITHDIKTLANIIEQIPSKAKVSHNLISQMPIEFKKNNSFAPCPGGEKFLFINSIGIVSPCTWVSEHKPNYHQLSLHEYSLRYILNSKIFNDFNIIKNKISACPMQKIDQFNLVEQELSYFGKQNPIYSFSTENLEYLSKLKIQQFDKALTITGSGDQIINLSLLGFKYINTIDINLHAQYYAELKITCLINLSYKDFKNFFLKSNKSFSYELFKKIKTNLSKNAAEFWENSYKIFLCKGSDLRNSYYFKSEYENNEQKVINSFYLINQDLYLKAQKAIKKTQIFYLNKSIFDYAKEKNETFNLILTSNLNDYSHKFFPTENHLQLYKEQIVINLMNKLKKQGLLANYIFDANNILKSNERNLINDKDKRKELYSSVGHYKEMHIDSAIPDALMDCIYIIKKENEK